MNYNKLKDFISKKKFSIDDMATKVGLTGAALYSNFRKENMSLETFENICKELSIPPCEFFDGEKNAATTIQNSCNGLGNTIQIALSDCEKETRHLKEMLAEKEKRISLLERLLDKQ